MICVVKGGEEDINTLKEFRKRIKLNQKDFARTIGISVSYYSKVESGYRNPSYDFLSKLKLSYPEVNIDKMFFKTKHQ